MKNNIIALAFQIIKHKNCKRKRIGKNIRYSLPSQKLHFQVPVRLARKIDNEREKENYSYIYSLLSAHIEHIISNF